MAPSTPIIKIRDCELTLTGNAGPVHILRGVNLDVNHGEAVAIVGPSGSGKSSLMAVMTGLEGATGGTVAVDGIDLTHLDEDSLARFRRGRVGIVLQSFHLIPTMSALENVAVPLELAGEANPFARAQAELEAVGLGHRLDHYPAQLSGGEQQRVAIARATAPGPTLLCADEPTGNLDSTTGAAIIDLMFSLHRDRGSAMVLITHDPALASRCDRVFRMEDGRLLADEPTPRLREVPTAKRPDTDGTR